MTIGILELQTYPYVSPFRNLIHEFELNFEKQAKLYLRTQFFKLPFKLKNTFPWQHVFGYSMQWPNVHSKTQNIVKRIECRRVLSSKLILKYDSVFSITVPTQKPYLLGKICLIKWWFRTDRIDNDHSNND